MACDLSPSCRIVGLASSNERLGLAYTLGEGVASTGRPVRAAVAVPRLDCGCSCRAATRRAMRCSAICKSWRQNSWPQSCAVRGDQFVRRRDGQNDFAAEHRHRRVRGGHASGRRARCLRAPSSHSVVFTDAARHAGGGPAVSDPLDHPRLSKGTAHKKGRIAGCGPFLCEENKKVAAFLKKSGAKTFSMLGHGRCRRQSQWPKLIRFFCSLFIHKKKLFSFFAVI